MRNKRVPVLLLTALLLLLLFAGCTAGLEPVATPEPTPVATVAPSPEPTAEPAGEPSAAPCPTMTPEQRAELEAHKATLGGSY